MTENHCTPDDLGMKITGEDAGPFIAAMEEYLLLFAKPTKHCLKCEAYLTGMLGSFTWGLANGEGTCSDCGYPARAHHYPKLPDGTGLMEGDQPIQLILQYHPDHVTSGDSDE
ncbi:MAG: hypothetical protein HN879_09695 [Flavobacteriaceae bacterium]|nr:hypothetical protein [Flavobacteriaceae bacterium]